MHHHLVHCFLPLGLLASGCAPKAYVKAMGAAAVDIPNEIQRVAVVDRSSPKNTGQSVLGAIEGALSGEQPFEDHRGRERATQELIRVLEASPRYTVINPNVTPEEVASDLLDVRWTYRKVAALCDEHGCDAVIALETFDTDTDVTSGLLEALQDPDPKPTPRTPEAEEEPPPPTHWAERRTQVNATWRMYDAEADRILDEVRERTISSQARQEAHSLDEAVARLASPGPMVESDGRQLGQEYGRRVAPTWKTLRRKYYGGAFTPFFFTRAGRPFRQAVIHVEARDWEGAAEIWKEVAKETGSERRRGKAHYDLALAAEVDGNLEKALRLAKKAAIELHSGRSRDYVRSLEYRIEEQARVEVQLAPPEE